MGRRLGLDFDYLGRLADASFYLWAYDFGLGMFAGWIEGNSGMWIWA